MVVRTGRSARRGERAAQSAPRGAALTLRLDAETYRRLRRLAQAENRSPTNYVETLLLRDVAAREEAARVITMLVPDEAAALRPGVLLRSEGESDARYAERGALFDELFAMPDNG